MTKQQVGLDIQFQLAYLCIIDSFIHISQNLFSMMFLTNIGLSNNTASTHSELIQAIENAGFEVSQLDNV